jgi:aminoglycoside phosphotransferase (APT) family kinase protein
MRHGYTNATISDGRTVVKRFLGPDAATRQRNEVVALTALVGLLPVPSLLRQTEDAVTLTLVEGQPGQERLETAPEPVLYAVGRLAGRLATIDISRLPGLAVTPSGTVLVHGDFGPQNMVFDDLTDEPTALLDWEHVHVGKPVEDLAWAEWIVRTHHAHLLAALPALFAGYGERPPWRQRHAVMLEKCRWALGFARRWPGAGTAVIELWQQRRAATRAYAELP